MLHATSARRAAIKRVFGCRKFSQTPRLPPLPLQLPATNGKACSVLAPDGRARWERQQHWEMEASGLRCLACTTLAVAVVQAALEP